MGSYFPLFVDLSEKEIVVIGAGKIASRRIQTLSSFTKRITVIAPEASAVVQKLAEQGSVRLLLHPYIEGEIPKEAAMVLAATNSKEVNEAVYRECREKGILVNVCSEKEKCDFYFPGIVKQEDLVIGVTAGGQDHRMARIITERIREALQQAHSDTETAPK